MPKTATDRRADMKLLKREMKKILVPTDFSPTAKCGLFYASRLAETWGGARIQLTHVFMPAVESEFPGAIPPIEEIMRVREYMLEEFASECCAEVKLENMLGVTVERELRIGFPADEISRISADFDYIVMGATGATDTLNRIFGSVSTAIAKRAKCPVILVPKGLSFRGFRNILYASNYESADLKMIEALLRFNRGFNACIHFVHVRDDKREETYDKPKEEIFKDLFAAGDPGFAFQMAEVEGDTVLEGVQAYAAANEVDLIVVVNRQRSFWDGFFQRSETARLAGKTRAPLMVFHQ
jgi:nucleotide-binding universal stress UspA family protein